VIKAQPRPLAAAADLAGEFGEFGEFGELLAGERSAEHTHW